MGWREKTIQPASKDKSHNMIFWPLHHLWNSSLSVPGEGKEAIPDPLEPRDNAVSAWPPGISAAPGAAMWDLGTRARQSQAVLPKLTYYPKNSAPAPNLAPVLGRSVAGYTGHTLFLPVPLRCSPKKTASARLAARRARQLYWQRQSLNITAQW